MHADWKYREYGFGRAYYPNRCDCWLVWLLRDNYYADARNNRAQRPQFRDQALRCQAFRANQNDEAETEIRADEGASELTSLGLYSCCAPEPLRRCVAPLRKHPWIEDAKELVFLAHFMCVAISLISKPLEALRLRQQRAS